MAVAVVLLALAGCSSDPRPTITAPTATLAAVPTPSPTPPPVVFPGEQWDRADRGDWASLDGELASTASTCVAVVQDGELVHDAYFNGGSERAPVRTYSITKSLTSLLVGMASDRGELSLDDTAATQVPQWRGTPASAVTVRDLLAMTSGRAWSEATDRQLIRGSSDQTAYAVGLGQAGAPGEWVYDNSAPQVLERVLAGATGESSVVNLAQRDLLGPLGMRDTVWPTDATGHATTYSGVESTCLDLARIGYLVLNQGTWDDQQLVSTDYVKQLSTPSSDRNAAYGLLWWTNAEGRVVEVLRQAGFTQDKAPYRGRLAPDVPADAIWAFGYGNQYVAVVPSLDLVAVRLGRRPATSDQVTFDSFTSGVIEALGSR